MLKNIEKDDLFFQPRIMIVDDEERIRKACDRFLTEEGCKVEMAENGKICLEMINKKHFDIILLDLMMPGMSGLDVLKQVKTYHPDTVVIVVTGYATLEHSIETMKKGAFDFLSKPFSPKELRLVINKAIEFIRTLQDIATEKSRMRVMINTLCSGVLTTDHQKNVALANPAFLKLMGCQKSRVIGRPVSELFDQRAILDMIDKAAEQSEDNIAEITDEIMIPGIEEGDNITIGVRCIPFQDRLHRNLGTVTVLQDITDLKRIDQLKSDFVSMVAHEIKSPLNTVLMQLNNLLSGLAGDLNEQQTQILSRSQDKIKSLTNLSSELLDLSKIESGLINQERQEINIFAIMVEQVEFYTEKACSKSISLEMETTSESIKIMGNLQNIEEIFSNLISNAIRYTPEGGSILVLTQNIDDWAIIKVTDTGFGIPEEEMDNIFTKFYRIKTKETRFINGTGLGLPIVKSIVQAHHGSIKVESAVGSGTSFSIRLPDLSYKM
jgi:two-component system phosphate regulon sensor histidine kinase PhoR